MNGSNQYGVLPHHDASAPLVQPNEPEHQYIANSNVNPYEYHIPQEPKPVNLYPDAKDIDMSAYQYMPEFKEVAPVQEHVASAPPLPQYEGTVPQPHPMEHVLTEERPTSPLLIYTDPSNDRTFGMPVKRVMIESELHVQTAFTRITVTFINSCPTTVSGLFVLPTAGTVTNCDVSLSDTTFLGTTYISAEDAAQFNKKKKGKTQEDNPIDQFIPDVFRLPIANIEPNDIITIEVDLMETLRFIEGRYHMTIPLRFGKGVLPDTSLRDIISIRASINSLTPGIIYGSSSHELILTGMENLRSELVAVPLQHQVISADFHLAYRLQTNEITAALIHEGPEYSYDNRGAFVCFVNPPSYVSHVVGRDIIFLIDRSGSMYGEPFKSASKGLAFALDTLQPQDRFGIVAFDHERVFFNGASPDLTEAPLNALFPAERQNIAAAKEFVFRNDPRGATDIRTPVTWALNTLKSEDRIERIPFVVLLTDGAVRDEKEICRDVERNAGRVRILTFGIGQHCNWYFLKVLSLKSRGWNEGSLYEEDLFPKMRSLVERASAPVMTNVEINIAGVSKVDLYPETIPDLFVGGPITISGKYKGQSFPPSIELSGICGGQRIVFEVRTDTSKIVSVNRVFLKQRMDQLTAKQWLTDSLELRKEMVDLSIRERFPSRYTSLVAYQMTPEERRARDGDDQKKNVAASKRPGLSAKQVAGLAGGAVVVGAGLVVLGSVAATMGGASGIMPAVGGGLGGLDLDVFGGAGCCDACGGCGGFDVDCGACLDCGACGGCGEIFGACNCDCDFGAVCGPLAEGFGALAGALGQCCSACGEVVSALSELI